MCRVVCICEEVAEANAIYIAIEEGLQPFASQIKRDVTKDDIDALLKIPIRRISLYDINKAKKEMREIRARLKDIRDNLNNIVGYTIDLVEYLIDQYKDAYPRRTEITSFDQVDVRDAAQRNLKLRYDKNTGYLGYEVNGNVLRPLPLLEARGQLVFAVDQVVALLGVGEGHVIGLEGIESDEFQGLLPVDRVLGDLELVHVHALQQ